MQKRKFRINILDVTIVILVICSAVALVFRDTINEYIAKPEIVTMEVTVVADSGDPVQLADLAAGEGFVLEGNAQVSASLKSFAPSESGITATFICNGYEKLGRYYTESGDLLTAGEIFNVISGETAVMCTVESAGIVN